MPRATGENKVNHPKSVYLREEQLLPHLDGWLSLKFDLSSSRRPCVNWKKDQPDDTGADSDAQREAAERDAKLCQHRARP